MLLFPSSSNFSLAIRVKERQCVKVVFEGGNLIQVTTSLYSFQILGVFPFAFTYLLCNSLSLYFFLLLFLLLSCLTNSSITWLTN